MSLVVPKGRATADAPQTPSRLRAAPVLLWGILALVLAGVIGAGVKAWVDSSPALREVLGLSGGDLPVLGTVPAFSLTERSGRAVRDTDLRGRIWIANFIFTRCSGVCPALSSHMARLQTTLRPDGESRLRLVSVSVDPAADTTEVLREYAARYRASADGWWFLTGDWQGVFDLVRNGFQLSLAQQPDAIDPGELITHSDRFVLVDASGRIRGYYRGTEEEGLANLTRDAQALLAAAGG
jgi:protein SCO1/2